MGSNRGSFQPGWTTLRQEAKLAAPCCSASLQKDRNSLLERVGNIRRKCLIFLVVFAQKRTAIPVIARQFPAKRPLAGNSFNETGSMLTATTITHSRPIVSLAGF